MKVVIIKPDDTYKAGTIIEATGDKLAALLDNGLAVTASEWQAQETAKANARKSIEQAVVRAKDRGAIPPKDEDVLKTSLARFDSGKADAEVLCEFIDTMQIQASKPDLSTRITQPVKDGEPIRASGVQVTGIGIDEASKAVLQASAPQDALIRQGRFAEAKELAREAATIMQQNHMKIVRGGGDFLLRDTVKAATTTDPNGTVNVTNNVGSLAGDLITLRNLGYLVNKLPWIGKLTTDLSAEPAKFGQSILTRYLTPPPVLTWVPGVGFTDTANAFGLQQQKDANDGTNALSTQAGQKTLSGVASSPQVYDAANNFGIPSKSVPLAQDKSVALNMFKATEIEFPVSMVASTIRNLFSEQLGAQTYSLAEEINKYVLYTLFSSTWSGTKTSYTKALANWSLSSVIGIKNAMTISKIPDVNRFCLLHSYYHDKLLEDSNLLSAKAIMALLKKDESEFNTGELPTLFGVKVLESQLASATSAGALTTWTDDTNLGTTNIVGFAGNMSSGLFVSRPPQDFTTAMTQLGIPQTASVRLVTEPDSGLTVMVFSYADNGKMSLNQRVCLMYGAAQGDPRVGILVKAA